VADIKAAPLARQKGARAKQNGISGAAKKVAQPAENDVDKQDAATAKKKVAELMQVAL
jgi:hypothetical protein